MLELDRIGRFLAGLRSGVGAVTRAAARAKVLLVDDQVENLVALEAVLEPLGQTLVRAGLRPRGARAPAPRRVRPDPDGRPDA